MYLSILGTVVWETCGSGWVWVLASGFKSIIFTLQAYCEGLYYIRQLAGLNYMLNQIFSGNTLPPRLAGVVRNAFCVLEVDLVIMANLRFNIISD